MANLKFRFFFILNIGLIIKERGLSKPNQLWKLKLNHPKAKKKVFTNTKEKSNTQTPYNHDIICFQCLRITHIASSYPNKRVMILHHHKKIEPECDSNDEKMFPI